MTYNKLPANQVLFREGDEAHNVYILTKGSLKVYVKNEMVNRIEQGQVFGEIALLYNCPRTAMIKAGKGDSFIWALKR